MMTRLKMIKAVTNNQYQSEFTIHRKNVAQ